MTELEGMAARYAAETLEALGAAARRVPRDAQGLPRERDVAEVLRAEAQRLAGRPLARK